MMPTDVGNDARASSAAAGPPGRPIVLWAIFGAVCTLLALSVYIRWFTSGHAQHVSAGPDQISGSTEVWIWIFQIGSPLLALLALCHAVRSSQRIGRLSFDAMLVIAGAVAWWHDPLINWLRPSVFYNAELVNLGSWSEQVPGWISRNARFHIEPPLMIGTVYVWLGLAFAMVASSAMRRAKARWPQLGMVRLVVVGWVAVFPIEFLLELLVVRVELVAYPAAVHPLSLWAGTTHQMPVYGMMLWSAVLTSEGVMRYRLDSRGFSPVEQGADQLGVSERVRTGLRLLAVIGAVHGAALTYDAAMNVAGLYAGGVDEWPTYLRTRQCGEGTPVGCPSPDAPILPGG
jgi:hypothetical protein